MTPERWRRIEEVFQGAAERKSEERGRYLEEACAGDAELRREVESLLDQSSGALLDQPALRAAAALLDTGAVDQATQLAGRRVSHYEILEKLGEGGMGVVYKARDFHLDRFVAIKVLPPERVADPERKRRLALEARAASALNHPNIVTVYDIQRVANVDFIAMEYVEGRTLHEAIGRKGLKLNEALKYAIQIADAVAKAHAAGIVHRDLKPGNVMVTPEGRVKILDFGLAKLTEPEVQPEGETRTERQSTELGAIMGTAGYMSPEQAAGKKVEARSDIFSFGSLLYEMLTGRRAFRKETPALTLAAILHTEPPPLGPEIPHEVEKVVMHCLRKDPARRYQYMADVKVALEDLKEESESGALEGAAVIERKGRRRWLWIAAAAATLLLAVTLAWRLREAARPADFQTLTLTSYAGNENWPSFSPDGNKVAFVWNGTNRDNYDIYVKRIGSAGPPARRTTSPMADGAPVWSPDGDWIAFGRQLQGAVAIFVIPSDGGPERKIAELLGAIGLCWTPDSKWLVVGGRDSPKASLAILAFSVETRERRKLTEEVTVNPLLYLVPGDRNPAISPDGETLAFGRLVANYVFGVYTLRLTPDMRPAGKPTRIVDQDYDTLGRIAWTADGREIVYSAGDSQRLWRVGVSGGRPPKALAAQPPALAPAIAPTGRRLAYAWRDYSQNLWRLDTRTGERKMLIGSTYLNMIPQYSPDGRKIAFGSNRGGNMEIWTCDADGENCQQLTFFGGPLTGTPRWSPDSTWLAFDSRAEGQTEIYVIPADGGAPRRMTFHPGNDAVPSWSRDGHWIYFGSQRSGRGEVWKVPAGGGEPEQVTHNGGGAALESPDGNLYYMKARALFKMPVAGGEEQQVLPLLGFYYDFAVSEKGVYFISPDSIKRTIQLLDRVTGKVSILGDIDENAYGICVSPDGAYVLWGQLDRDTTDLRLVENFR